MLSKSQLSRQNLKHPDAATRGGAPAKLGKAREQAPPPLAKQVRGPGLRLRPPAERRFNRAPGAPADPVQRVLPRQRENGIAAAFRRAWHTLFKPVSFNRDFQDCLERYNEAIKLDGAVQIDPALLDKRLDVREKYLNRMVEYAGQSGRTNNQLTDWLLGIQEEMALLAAFRRDLMPALVLGDVRPNLSLNSMLELLKAEVPAAVVLDGMSRQFSKLDIQYVLAPYTAQGVPMNEKTYPGVISPDRVQRGSAQHLGAGTMNAVSVFEYLNDDGSSQPLVFKPLQPQALSDMGLAAGMDELSPNLAGRNMAAAVIARRMGAEHVVAGATMALYGGQLGIVMPLVRGRSPRDEKASLSVMPAMETWLAKHPQQLQAFARSKGFGHAELKNGSIVFHAFGMYDKERPSYLAPSIGHQIDFSKPTIREGLTTLQWADVLMGNVDRNPGNYKISARGEVRGFDHDLVAGSAVGVYESGQTYAGAAVAIAPRVPRVISRELRQSILKMKAKDLRRELAPYLSRAEVDARISAMWAVQEILESPEEHGVLVLDALEDWGSQEASDALGVMDIRDRAVSADEFAEAVERSYVARDALAQAEQQHTKTQALKLEKYGRLQRRPGADATAIAAEVKQVKDSLRGTVAPVVFDPMELSKGLDRWVSRQQRLERKHARHDG